MVYSHFDYDNANSLLENLRKASGTFGIKVHDPQYIECPKDKNSEDYMAPIRTDIDPKFTQFVVVLLSRDNLKAPIKALLDKMGIPSQFILSNTVKRGKGLSVYSNVLKQINAKSRADLYKMSLPSLRKTMIVGTNLVNTSIKGRTVTLMGLSASYNSTLSQYYSNTVTHDLPRREDRKEERLTKDQKEVITTERRTKILQDFIVEALRNYQKMNNGALPDQVVVYRDSVGGPTL